MKIGKVGDLSVFVDKSDNLLEIELPVRIPPYPFEKNILQSKEYKLAILFKYLRSFNYLVTTARKELELEKLFEFPSNFTLDVFYEMYYKLPQDKRNILTKFLLEIQNRYSLLDNWDISIKTIILTNHLPIAFSSSPINYYIPPTEEELQREREEAKNQGIIAQARLLSRTAEVTNHPAIYFDSKTSPTALIQWINSHKFIFKVINRRLNKETSVSSKMSVRTLQIGELALILRWDNVNRWRDMQEKIDEWYKNEEYDDYWGIEGRPTAEDIRAAFNSFRSVIVQLESGNSESL